MQAIPFAVLEKGTTLARSNRLRTSEYALTPRRARLRIAHAYDHTFPLRSKAPKGMKPKYLRRNLSKFVRLYLRKQAHYRAREGE